MGYAPQGNLAALVSDDAMVWFDSINGVPGTTYPIGTAEQPVNNVADALLIAAARTQNTIKICDGIFTFAGNMTDYNFIGSGWIDENWDEDKNLIVLAGFTATNCTFTRLNIVDGNPASTLTRCSLFDMGINDIGVVNSSEVWRAYHFEVDTVSANCEFRDIWQMNVMTATGASNFVDIRELRVPFPGTAGLRFTRVTFQPGRTIGVGYFTDCHFIYNTIFDENLSVTNMYGCHGVLNFQNLTSGGNINIIGGSIEVSVAASCTTGSITLVGDHRLVSNLTGGTTVNDYTVKAQTDKLAGGTPGVGTATEDWNAAEADIVSIGTNDTRNKLHSLLVNISAMEPAATISIRMYMQVNGVERKVYDQDFVKGTDPDGVWIVNGTVGIHEVLRVTAQSDDAGDDGKAINYDYMLEVM